MGYLALRLAFCRWRTYLRGAVCGNRRHAPDRRVRGSASQRRNRSSQSESQFEWLILRTELQIGAWLGTFIGHFHCWSTDEFSICVSGTSLMDRKVGLLIFLCARPGTVLSLLTALSIGNGDKLFGISTEWLVNCTFRAFPLLAGLVGLLLFAVHQ